MVRPEFRLTGIVLDSANARELASFCEGLLGWIREKNEPSWVKLVQAEAGPGLSFQSEPEYMRPRWPSTRQDQQMMALLDFGIDDLDEAVR